MPKARYKNGNSIVTIDLSNGTKERFTNDDEFDLEFPESIDFNIGNKCDGGCPHCYINATPNGIDANLIDIPFINTIRPYTEVAINGNSVDHPQLIPFLIDLRKRNIIANITVNQIHFERKLNLIKELVDKDLIKGIGVSLRKPTPEFIANVQKFPNAVIHTIVGILSPSDLEIMRDKNLKLLILGYKTIGRGVDYKNTNDSLLTARRRYLYDVLETLPSHFNVVSFDNLAIEQLNPRRFLTDEQWNSMYMGDEGTASMYIDLVTGKFGVSSLCSADEMMPITDDICSMFKVVKSLR